MSFGLDFVQCCSPNVTALGHFQFWCLARGAPLWDVLLRKKCFLLNRFLSQSNKHAGSDKKWLSRREGITVKEIELKLKLNFKNKNTRLFSIHGNKNIFLYQILLSLKCLLTFNPASSQVLALCRFMSGLSSMVTSFGIFPHKENLCKAIGTVFVGGYQCGGRNHLVFYWI